MHSAETAFEAMGADGFADRAGRAILATGQLVRRRVDDTRFDLTPQERQIAELARSGLSNPEIATQLFVSPRTVEYHLGKVFAKLGIRSRGELPAVLGADRGGDPGLPDSTTGRALRRSFPETPRPERPETGQLRSA